MNRQKRLIERLEQHFIGSSLLTRSDFNRLKTWVDKEIKDTTLLSINTDLVANFDEDEAYETYKDGLSRSRLSDDDKSILTFVGWYTPSDGSTSEGRSTPGVTEAIP